MRRLISFLFVFLTIPAYAQLAPNDTLKLSCVHLYPIEMKYLETHLNYSKLTPNLQTRTIEQFVKKLDGSKLYLLKSDVDKIHHMMAHVFKETKDKDCSALTKVNEFFAKKVAARVDYAKKYLGPKFKVDSKAEIERDPDKRPWPRTNAQAQRFQRMYMQYQIATYLSTDMKLDKARAEVVRNYERAYRRVKDFTKQDLYTAYLDSFARALDPHSDYMSADELQDFEIQMRLSLEGIGATLSSEDGFTVIEQLIPGGAASLSGKLKTKDRIIAVAQGKDGQYKNVIEMELRDVVKLIRGPKGSEVRLKILRKTGKATKRFEVTLIRKKIELKDEAASISYVNRKDDGKNVKIGLLNLPSFYADNLKNGPSAGTDMKRLLADARKNKADAIVLDLSSNGGGSLRDAVEIAGLFFKTGNVVKQSERATPGLEQVQYETLRDTDSDVDWPGPLVILTSRVSASASEIVSGTLKAYHRAVIVGADHTFGKGTVQSVQYLPPGLGAIKTTVGMFFTAGGFSTQHHGVRGEIVFPSILTTQDIGEQMLDYSLPPKRIASFVSKSAYVSSGPGAWVPITPKIIRDLRKKALPRIAVSKDFKKIREDIVKAKKHGNMIEIADLLKKDKDSKGKKGDKVSVDDPEDLESLTPAEREKRYLKRPDINEALNVAADLAIEEHAPTLQLGSEAKKPNGSAN